MDVYLINNITNMSAGLTSSKKNTVSSVLFSSLMFLIGVFGNVTALLILIKRPSKDSKCTAFYQMVKALVVCDLLGILLSSPVVMIGAVTGAGIVDTGGIELCRYFACVMVWAGNATLFIVLMMAVERFLVTRYPFQYGRIVTTKSTHGCLVFIFLGSVLSCLLPVVGLGSYTDRWPGTWCFFDFRSSDIGNRMFSIAYGSVGLLIIFLVLVLNSIVIHHMIRMRTQRMSTTSSVRSCHPDDTGGNPRNTGNDSETRMVVFLMAIIIALTASYAPLMVRVLMNQIYLVGRDVTVGGLDDNLELWGIRFASFNQTLDPWVYIISRVTCCRARCWVCRWNSQTTSTDLMKGRAARVWQRFRRTLGARKPNLETERSIPVEMHATADSIQHQSPLLNTLTETERTNGHDQTDNYSAVM